ncbi:hypothetical protein [Flavobacterium tegetincola]|uniref:hypothetical protein n=1 Tax=Flavobacterium tegetincola TaxID=150172 RepID=UPI0004279970|nr:hypothetical protein [Flavobacterium tegetincola]
MAYSVAQITTVADCDLLLSLAAKEKADQNFKKLSEERLTLNYSTTSIEIDADLQSVATEIAATETVIATLPEGKSKEEAIKKKTKLEYRRFLLNNRKESYGVLALLEKELDLNRVTVEISEIDAFITAINARKAEM